MSDAMPCNEWVERLSGHADGELLPAEHAAVEQHLAACPACRDWLEAVRQDARLYAQAYAEPARSEAYVADVMERLPARQSGKTQRRFRFTLIELGVCAAIVGILGVVTLPVFARAREKARQSSCSSNLKQLGLGMLLFAQDHGNCFPSALTWQRDILPYVKSEQFFRCTTDDSGQVCSYAMNAQLSQADLDTLPTPEAQVLLYDANAWGTPAKRHNEGLNVGFADGHVKWYRDLPQALMGRVSLGARGHNYGLAEELHRAYEAAVAVVTDDALRSLRSAERIVGEQGGFVLQADYRKGKRLATSTLTCKVPAGNLEATLSAFQALGSTTTEQLAGVDATQDVVAAEVALRREDEKHARLAQEASRTREPDVTAALRADLEQSEERTLTNRRKQYDVLSRTVLSTVCATFESPVPRPSARTLTTSALHAGWHWSSRTVGVAGAWALGLAPVWVPVAVGALCIRWCVRRRRPR